MIVTTFVGADSDDILKIILATLKPNGKAIFLEHSPAADGTDPLEQLRLSGFQNATKTAQNGKLHPIRVLGLLIERSD